MKVETVEIIRCKNCKYKNSVLLDGCEVPICGHEKGLCHIESNSYCSYAEKKDKERG